MDAVFNEDRGYYSGGSTAHSHQEVHVDKNGHRVNRQGELLFDELCEVCKKKRRTREDSHITKKTRGK